MSTRIDRLSAPVVAASLLVSAGPAAAEVKIAVLPTQIEATAGFSGAAFDEILLEATQRELGVSVIGPADIEVMLGFEKQREAFDCEETTCLVQLGGALGVNYVLSVRAAKLGAEWAVTAKLIDVQTIVVLARSTEIIVGGPKELLLSSGRIISNLAATLDQPLDPRERKPAFFSEQEWVAFKELRAEAARVGIPDVDPQDYQTRIAPRRQIWMEYFAWGAPGFVHDISDAALEAWQQEHWYGGVRVSSNPPGAKVAVDGEARGVTPLTVRGRGDLVIAVELEGYYRQERTVSLAPGPVGSIDFQLESIAALQARALEAEASRKVMIPLMWTGFIGAAVFGGAAGALIGAATGPVRESIASNYALVHEARNPRAEEEQYAEVQRGIELHNGLLVGGIVAGGVGVGLLALGFTMLGMAPDAVEPTLILQPGTGAGHIGLRARLP